MQQNEESLLQPELESTISSTRLDFNSKISSHSQKRNAVETANAHPLVQTTWLCIMAGWVMKAVHTIYDYLKGGNRSNDEQVALCLSGWNQPGYLGRLGGGHPPLISALQEHSEYEKVKRFVSTLFFVYRENDSFFSEEMGPDMKDRMFDMATAAILLRLKAFINVLLKDPRSTYGSESDHPDDELRRFDKAFDSHLFLRKLHAAANSVGLDIATLLEWSDLVEKDFIRRNFVFAAWSDVRRVIGDDSLEVDTRNLCSFMEGIIANHREQNNQINDLRTIAMEERQHRIAMQERLANTEATCQMTLAATQRIEALLTGGSVLQTPNTDVNGATAAAQPACRIAIESYIAFPGSLDRLEIKSTVYNWFVCGHYLAIGTNQVSNRDVANKLKFCVEYYSLFLETHVPALPEGVTRGNVPEAAAWRGSVRQLIDEAWTGNPHLFRGEEPTGASIRFRI